MEKRPKIGLLSPYWNFWEAVVEDDPQVAHTQLVDQAAALVGEHGEVVWSVLAEELDTRLPAVDLILVVVTMASPPAPIREFLETRPESIVLVWAHHPSPQIDEPFTHQSITVRGATVGASMLTASLSRAAIAHDVVLGDASSDQVRRSLRAAVAAASIRGARLLVVGEPIEGYDFVVPPAAEVNRLGIELVAHHPDELAERAERRAGEDLDALRAELGEGLGSVTTEVGEGVALRYAHALQELADDVNARAGTVNCHGPSLRKGSRGGGVAPCFALGRQTSRGRPFTCTGDVNTALAMLLVSALGRPTMYHEMEAIDETTEEVILANSGEHDDRFSAGTPARVVANPWFPGANPTPIVAFQVASGPASVVAVTVVDDRLRVIVAEGRFTDRPTESTGTMSAAFQFGSSPAAEGWRDWVRAGAGHHACATDEHIRADLIAVCRHLGLDLVSVGNP